MIYVCARCQILHEQRSSDLHLVLCAACHDAGWRLDTLGNLLELPSSGAQGVRFNASVRWPFPKSKA